MITFNLSDIFPKFILSDSNGFAMAKALEAALHYFLGKCQDGIDTLQNPDKMPEWRLDEMAWELNCLYDYEADISIKREWIRNAYQNYRIHGTAEGVRQYLQSYFGQSEVEEYFEFGGQPGEFKVIVQSAETAAHEQWIRNAVERAKNVRSTLKQIIYMDDLVADDIMTATGLYGEEIHDQAVMFTDTRPYTVYDVERLTVELLEQMNVGQIGT